LARQRIATLRERGHGVREIARRIGRAASTVSRELRTIAIELNCSVGTVHRVIARDRSEA